MVRLGGVGHVRLPNNLVRSGTSYKTVVAIKMTLTNVLSYVTD